IEPLPLNYLINYTSTIEDPELLYPDEEDNSELDSEIQKGAQTIQELEIIRETLHDDLSPTLLESIRPYETMTFSPDRIVYDNQFCTWYYIEHIRNDLVEKIKEKDLPKIGKVPAPNVGVETNCTAPVMNALLAMLSYSSGQL